MIRTALSRAARPARSGWLAMLLITAAVPLAAQGNPVADAARRLENGRALLAAAKAMPADKYGFKPTPAQMSFGGLIAHIAGDNRTTCAAISGTQPPAADKVSPTDSKDKLMTALEQSISFCNSALGQLHDAQLGDSVTWYGSRTTKAMATMGLLIDWADHYGQQAMYLRLNGILPPTARH
jgi:uncharacterized damage-inducible protein DinB